MRACVFFDGVSRVVGKEKGEERSRKGGGMKNRNRARVSMKWIMVLCFVSFGLGILFSNRFFFIIHDRVSLSLSVCVSS